MTSPSPDTWLVEPIATALGAIVRGPDLAQPVTQAQWDRIDALFAEHLVLVFPDQHLTPERHIELGEHFGVPYVHPHLTAVEGHPPLLSVIKEATDESTFGGEHWHCDISYEDPPAATSLLYSLDVPALGGDTLFANQYLAYERLSPAFRAMIEPLRAHHTYPGMAETDPDAHAVHPIVRVHPVTGRRAIYVNAAFVERIDEMTVDESAPILEALFHHQVRPEFQCRVTWQPDQLVIWDNRATLHYAMDDYPGIRRELHRITSIEAP